MLLFVYAKIIQAHCAEYVIVYHLDRSYLVKLFPAGSCQKNELGHKKNVLAMERPSFGGN